MIPDTSLKSIFSIFLFVAVFYIVVFEGLFTFLHSTYKRSKRSTETSDQGLVVALLKALVLSFFDSFASRPMAQGLSYALVNLASKYGIAIPLQLVDPNRIASPLAIVFYAIPKLFHRKSIFEARNSIFQWAVPVQTLPVDVLVSDKYLLKPGIGAIEFAVLVLSKFLCQYTLHHSTILAELILGILRFKRTLA